MNREVRYTGNKATGMPIMLPIGVKTRSSIEQTIIANPTAVLSESDAAALVELDPQNFELGEFLSDEPQQAISDESETLPAPKKRGRKKKVNAD